MRLNYYKNDIDAWMSNKQKCPHKRCIKDVIPEHSGNDIITAGSWICTGVCKYHKDHNHNEGWVICSYINGLKIPF